MDISDWRTKIDALDLQIVELLNQRAEAARAIGMLKEATDMPVYEPNRERSSSTMCARTIAARCRTASWSTSTSASSPSCAACSAMSSPPSSRTSPEAPIAREPLC